MSGDPVTTAQAFKQTIDSIASGGGVVSRVIVAGQPQPIYYTPRL